MKFFFDSLEVPQGHSGIWSVDNEFQLDIIEVNDRYDLINRQSDEKRQKAVCCYDIIMTLSEDFDGGIASFMESNEEDVGVLCRIKPNTGSGLVFSDDIIYEVIYF